ncbi:hypothetical protein NDU88_007038 [Pleurodeles waltl]|uniref:Uncharacterized protein n=1 Tax=Pleurodeles waltl TaxID=8319 RepID=A0AAV7PK62_PLEWA|nr:hypothetical protein NDU88_007038 [Pleurodeles waltl]
MRCWTRVSKGSRSEPWQEARFQGEEHNLHALLSAISFPPRGMRCWTRACKGSQSESCQERYPDNPGNWDTVELMLVCPKLVKGPLSLEMCNPLRSGSSIVFQNSRTERGIVVQGASPNMSIGQDKMRSTTPVLVTKKLPLTTRKECGVLSGRQYPLEDQQALRSKGAPIVAINGQKNMGHNIPTPSAINAPSAMGPLTDFSHTKERPEMSGTECTDLVRTQNSSRTFHLAELSNIN